MLPVSVEKYNIHEDYRIKITFSTSPGVIRIAAGLSALANRFMPRPAGILSKKTKIKSLDGTPFGLEILSPEEIDRPAPCVIYYHGGGFVLGCNPLQERLLLGITKEVPYILISVDYRLALDHPFPAGVEDCYAAALWVAKNAAKLRIDPDKIAVVGDSAGGALAAAVTQMIRDQHGPKICFQMLLYPVTDCSMSTHSANEYVDTPIWNAIANRKMWQLYLRDTEEPISPYASPIHAETLRNLPSAYIETAEFDPLHDEGENYAARLQSDGVDVILNNTRGTVHGYDLLKENDILKESLAQRTQALKKAFQ